MLCHMDQWLTRLTVELGWKGRNQPEVGVPMAIERVGHSLTFLSQFAGHKCRPGTHEVSSLLKQICPMVSSLYLVFDGVC